MLTSQFLSYIGYRWSGVKKLLCVEKKPCSCVEYNISTEYMELIHTCNVDPAKIYTWNATAHVVNRF